MSNFKFKKFINRVLLAFEGQATAACFKQPNFGNHLFTFFKRFEIKRNVRILPITDLKKEMTNYNSAEDFLTDCIESNVLTEYRHLLDVSKEHKKFKFKTLYEYYKDWVREYNCGKGLFKQKLFKRIVLPYLIEHNDKHNVHNT